MQLTFAQISAKDAPSPNPGELFIRAAALDDRGRRDVATQVLEHGLAWLDQEPLRESLGEGDSPRFAPRTPQKGDSPRQFSGPIRTIVVDLHPTLDEMLAATFARELLAGRPLPAAARAFANYADLVRKGLTPGNAPVETSLEGLFLALLNVGGDKLDDPANAQRFTADWEAMAGIILRAIEAGDEPFEAPLFTDLQQFARQRAFLANDKSVFQQDVRRGEQWIVDIPGGAAGSPALVLRNPKSLLFKQWSRREPAPGSDQPFIFLAVCWDPGEWVFSTDPFQQLPLKPLHAVLQTAEAKADPQRAVDDPWFDGQPYDFTMVAAPRRGTALSDSLVLKIVRQWTHARSLSSGRLKQKLPTVAVAVACVVLGIAVAMRWIVRPDPVFNPNRGMDFVTVSDETVNSVADIPTDVKGTDYALLFATDTYDDPKAWRHLCNAQRDANAIARLLKAHYGFEDKNVELCLDFNHDDFEAKIQEYETRDFKRNDQLFIYIAGHGDKFNKTGYLVFKNSKGAAAKDMERINSYYPLDLLKSDVEKIQTTCGHVFLVIDTCFSGMIDFDDATGQRRGTDKPTWQKSPKAELIRKKMANRSCEYLTSVGPESASDGKCGAGASDTHSPFADHIIALLMAPPAGGVLTSQHIFADVDNDQTQDPRYAQIGARTDPKGGFIFIWQK